MNDKSTSSRKKEQKEENLANLFPLLKTKSFHKIKFLFSISLFLAFSTIFGSVAFLAKSPPRNSPSFRTTAPVSSFISSYLHKIYRRILIGNNRFCLNNMYLSGMTFNLKSFSTCSLNHYLHKKRPLEYNFARFYPLICISHIRHTMI